MAKFTSSGTTISADQRESIHYNGNPAELNPLKSAELNGNDPEVTNPALLSVKLNVDASDAIAALKSIQREARKAAAALRELESVQSRTYGINRVEINPLASAWTTEEIEQVIKTMKGGRRR